MSKRRPSGFISTFYDPLKNPNAPTIGTATAGNTSASVPFTAPTKVGGSAITEYNARSTPGDVTASAASSPISVTGLTNGTAYTFAVWAINSYGPSAFSATSNSITPALPQRGLIGGGSSMGGSYSTPISYFEISTLGNASGFGDLNHAHSQGGALASSTRALFAGGTGTGGTRTNIIDYVTILTTGNATDFGDLTQAQGEMGGGASNETRGIWFTGFVAGFTNVIQYVTIASAGNATDFGDINANKSNCGQLASPTRAVFAGGYAGDPNNPFTHIGYVTIATTGNSTTFGDLVTASYTFTGCSSNTRGIFAGGQQSSRHNVIQYITIASTGNSTDFGDLTAARADLASVSSPTRAVFSYGTDNATSTALDYITIASEGNSVSFGSLDQSLKGQNGTSNCHGGLS